tara:strand:+ start:342 stop:797 length:456 start_codon:yes stop_codon:yes gene_type:complete
MRTSEVGINLIKHFEGIHEKPYKCPAGYWTVGCGHLISRNAVLPNSWNRTLTPLEIDELLGQDLLRFEVGLSSMLPNVLLTQNQFDALVSFCFNLGMGTFQRSTVRSALLRGDEKRAIEVLLAYCRSRGRVLRGLQKRRHAEANLFFSHIK